MIKQFLQALEATPWGTAVRENTWLFPTIESIHVLALVLVVGSIMVVDLRLLNLASRQRSVKELTDDVLPWTWSAFVLAAITGTGCMVSAVTGCFLAATPDDPLGAAVGALAAYGVAGEDAAREGKGPGSVHVALYDALAALDPATLDTRVRIA